MEALMASYGDNSSDSESEPDPPQQPAQQTTTTLLPPPPISLLHPPNSLGSFDFSPQTNHPNRVRCFPHAEGNFALHVYIPVSVPVKQRSGPALFLRKIAALLPELHVVDVDLPLSGFVKDERVFEQTVLGREFHVSLGRTVPIRVHQRDSVVGMLRQRLQSQKRYWVDFDKWEVFVNDDCTRTFLSIEVTNGGLAQIVKQIEAVNEVYKLHNLPEFYKDPRPHISVGWAVGDISISLKRIIEEEINRHNAIGVLSKGRIFTSMFGGISCKIAYGGDRVIQIEPMEMYSEHTVFSLQFLSVLFY